jgi:hypothetical protein
MDGDQLLWLFLTILAVGLALALPIWLYIVVRLLSWAVLRSWQEFFKGGPTPPNNHNPKE